ncbi:hypothetical protein PCANC_09954 [Puccinia coronata f. sp. avenae]|uniref:Uncharacterized protein n=1 Tax=Puccinia coronata f. sp. avenae TaxID=200324 RepID=A0A2N5V2Z3_9BASI|nr:hypothetical protein PCANC_09954 [Puccinia coronata f. sp. avenae]
MEYRPVSSIIPGVAKASLDTSNESAWLKVRLMFFTEDGVIHHTWLRTEFPLILHWVSSGPLNTKKKVI